MHWIATIKNKGNIPGWLNIQYIYSDIEQIEIISLDILTFMEFVSVSSPDTIHAAKLLKSTRCIWALSSLVLNGAKVFNFDSTSLIYNEHVDFGTTSNQKLN